jgi:hypothetical protein
MNTEQNPTAQGEVDQVDTADSNLEAALQNFLEQEAKCAKLEAELDNAKRFEAVARQTVIDKMLEQGVENFRALGYSITRSEFKRYSVLAADREKQMEWLRENGMGSIIVPSVNAQTFGAWVRNDVVKAGKQLPEFVKEYSEQRLLKRAV